MKKLFNPFVYLAGAKALGIGLAAIIVSAILGYFSRTHFDGVIDIHFGATSPLTMYFLEGFISWTAAVVIFYFTGLILSSSSIRFIDIAGTMALARWPLIFCAILGFFQGPMVAGVPHGIADIPVATIIVGLVSIVFSIWQIGMMYNAFGVSCNLKEGKAVGGFIVGLAIAEIISKIIFHFIK